MFFPRKRFIWRLYLKKWHLIHVRTRLRLDNYEKKQLRHSCTFKRVSWLAKTGNIMKFLAFQVAFAASSANTGNERITTKRPWFSRKTVIIHKHSWRVIMRIFSIGQSCLKDSTMIWRCVSGFKGWNFNVSWWKSKKPSMNQLLSRLTGDAKKLVSHWMGRNAVRFIFSPWLSNAQSCFRLTQKQLCATAQNFEPTTVSSVTLCQAIPISMKEKESRSWWCSMAGQSAQSPPFELKTITIASNSASY